jgi:long-subunit acyl-CoA synthetase (AMP-forming)
LGETSWPRVQYWQDEWVNLNDKKLLKFYIADNFLNYRNQTASWSYTFASFLVLKRIRKALGFDRCDLFVSAAAPISNEVVKYFMSLDIPLMEVYL